MTKILAISVACLWASAAFAADDGRWVTFKTGRNSQGAVLHQIDRASIRQEGPYRTFWTRIWEVRSRQPVVFGRNEQLLFWSQKFAVDCPHRLLGSRFIDSNQAQEAGRKTSFATMRWEALVPVVDGTVCGGR